MKRKLTGLFICTLMIASVFGSASSVNINSNVSNEKGMNTLEGTTPFGEPTFGYGGWHDEVVETQNGEDHTAVYLLGGNGYWTSPYDGTCVRIVAAGQNGGVGRTVAEYTFNANDGPAKYVKYEVNYKDIGFWSDGPDAKIRIGFNDWELISNIGGHHNNYAWEDHTFSDNADLYVNSNGEINVAAQAWDDGGWPHQDDISVKYMKISYQTADEEIYSATYSERDDNGDGYTDGVDLFIDANVGDYGDATTVDVTANAKLIDPNGNTIDTDSDTWTIIDWEEEFGTMTLSALPNGGNGKYTMEVTLYDEYGNTEGTASGPVQLTPDPQGEITFYTDHSSGGTVTFDGSTYNNGQSTTVSYGTYSITANPATYYVFDYWSDDQGCSVSDPNSQSTTVSVTGDGSITANFEYNLYEIDFYTNPTDGGTITFDGDTWSNGQSGNYQPGTYNIEANPANQHYFLDWDYGEDVTVANPNSQSTTATVTGSGWLTANFKEDPITYRIDFFCNPSFGGYLNFDGTDYQDGDYDNYPAGRYDINAKPYQGYQFYQWIPSPNINVDDIYEKKTKATVNGPGSLTVEFEAIPDLVCSGSLSWTDVTPGSTVTGSFDIANEGGPGADLDWEIVEWPSWGAWSFSDYNGNLESGGLITIEVEAAAPNEKESSFDGKVKIVNSDDPDDYCYITAYLATPKNKVINSFPLLSINSPLLKLLEQFPNAFPMLQQLLGL